MKPKTKGWTAALASTAVGIAGLAVIAMPAGAGEAPELPDISAEELVRSALSAEPPAFAGTVAIDNQLGLPSMPGMEFTDFDSARVYHDGADRARLAIQQGAGEQTFVKGTDDVWRYDSTKNTATRYPVPDDAGEHGRSEHEPRLSDPATAATEIIEKLSESSTITVDGTARIADRPAYELVLTPKPSERTLLREIKVAIDSETRLPLRLQVLPNGSPDPVVSVGFTEFSVGEQPDALFDFTPPKGAKVVEEDGDAKQDETKKYEADATEFGEGLGIVGDGWDTVVTGKLPEGALVGGQGVDERGRSIDPQALLDQIAKPVEGDFGTGYLISTRAGTGLLTDDGRFALGAVPQQVLIEALK